jgi:cation diffusion facilitator family transporter
MAMGCECSNVNANTAAERRTLRWALGLNAAMFVMGIVAGIVAQSTGVLADALDMLADATGYALALLAISRGPAFKRNAARWTGGVLLFLGVGLIVEVVRRYYVGSEPQGIVMMAYSAVSLAVNITVLKMLARFRQGEVHLRASYICTRTDVLANLAVFASGAIVAVTGLHLVDLLVGLALGIYVVKEALEILHQANEATGTCHE